MASPRARVLAITLALAAAAAPAARAESPPGGPVSVEDLVARAIAENPEILAAQADAEAVRGRLVQAGLRPNPMFELGGQKALSSDNSISVGLTIPLDLNRHKEGRVGVAEREPVREFFLGFVKIHILHHAGEEPVYGLALIAELRRHGYELSPGTLYPVLRQLEQTGYLRRLNRVVNGKVRK